MKKFKKLICSIEDKEKIDIHVRALKQAFNHGLILRKVHRIIQFNPIQVGFFRAAHGWGGGSFWPPLLKIRHTYPTMMILGAVVPYLRMIQKMHKSRDTFA